MTASSPSWPTNAGELQSVRSRGVYNRGVLFFRDSQTRVFPCKEAVLLFDRCMAAALGLAMGLAGAAAAEPDVAVDFNRDIRPLLSKHCLVCHGPDEGTREADLRLDLPAEATAARPGGPAIEPGKPDQSQLIARIESQDPDLVMPPADSGHALSPQDKQRLRQWIAAGAPYQVHWSFQPPQKASLPAVNQQDWPLHPIDYFVLQRLEANDMAPALPLDRLQLIRRLSLDLTGLPPTPAEADAFVADTSADAYANVVDRLLGSDAFGEHWARMWLDLARYADTKGYEKDLPRQMWRYRDWVIDALNDDLPYDQFTIEQLAGDLLPDATDSQRLATAFHRNTMTNDEGGTDNEEFRVAAVKDRVDTTLQVWMGLTMGCAKCHSHKYDPIGIDDYYAMFAFFNQTEDADRSDDAPLLASATKTQAAELVEVNRERLATEQALQEQSQQCEEAFANWRETFVDPPLWQPLTLSQFESKHKVQLQQADDGTLVAGGPRPVRDTWTVSFTLPAATTFHALRLDVLTQPQAGGEWADTNVALRELSVARIDGDAPPQALRLKAARADWSQSGWEVHKAIDGDPKRGWALSPQIGQPHVAVFDFDTPQETQPTTQLRLTLEQEYGESLLLPRFRVSVSTYASEYLAAAVDVEAGLKSTFLQHHHEPTKTLQAKLQKLKARQAEIEKSFSKIPVMRELPANKQRQTHIHLRGNFLSPGEPVTPAVPDVFAPFPEDAPLNRLGVAQWLMQADNPLTSRVMVNRIWARLFGIGLVETEEDFGTQGLLPTHPQLLDWLAVDFREQGWSLKQLLRSIVMSATYRQSSMVTERSLQLDPQNRLLGRGPRVRLSAEMVRDQALAVSGLLTHQVGGPSVMPPQPPGVWKTTYSTLQWHDDTGPNRFRRGVYTFWKRTSPYPANLTFDAGSGEVCLIRRIRTNTPLQALVTLNDTVFVEAAGALAALMLSSEGTVAEQIHGGFRRVLIRHPEAAEIERLVQLYDSLVRDFENDPQATATLLKSAGVTDAATAAQAAMLSVANVLLNLDETLMRP